MNKYYFFLASGAIKREELASALDGLGLAYDINYLAENKGYVLADETFAVMLQGIVLMIHVFLGNDARFDLILQLFFLRFFFEISR